MRVLLLCLTILATLVPAAWCAVELYEGHSLSFSSVAAFLPAVAALVAYLKTEGSASRTAAAAPSVAAHDQVLFADFQAALPFEPTIRVLREANFGADYRAEWLQPLNRFVESWDDPNREFLDATLEAERLALYRAALALATDFARETVPNDHNEGWRTVYPWRERGGPRPAHVLESARVLNEAARSFVPRYELFVRLARQRLNVAA